MMGKMYRKTLEEKKQLKAVLISDRQKKLQEKELYAEQQRVKLFTFETFYIELQEKRLKTEENAKRKLENQKKSETVVAVNLNTI